MSLSFDATFYQTQRPDVFDAFVATGGQTGLTWAQFAETHYDTFGRFEGSDPNASFDTSFYLSTYTDVAAAGVNPFTHFLNFGSLENRVPYDGFPNQGNGFDPAAYAAANADLAAAGITSDAALYQHFVTYGQFESRPGAPTVTPPGSGTTGETYVLTTAPDAFTGTPNDDTFVATQATLGSADTLDGAGGNDVLNYASSGGAAVNQAGFSSKAIETINVTSDAGGTVTSGTTFDVTGTTDVTTINNNNSSTDLTFVGGAAITTLGLISVGGVGAASTIDATPDTTVVYDAGVVAGASDAQTVNLNGNKNVDGTGVGDVTVNGIETINAATNGSASLINGFISGSLGSVVVTGDQDLTLGAQNFAANASTLDASAFTGNLNANLTNSAAVGVTATGGAGDDTVSFQTGGFTTGDSFDGGAGNDTIGLDAATASGAAITGTVNNVENLNVATITGAGTNLFDMDNFGGVTNVNFDAGLGAATTVDDAVTGLTVGVDVGAVGQNLTVDLKTDGTTDELSVAIDEIGTADNLLVVNIDDAETANVSVDDDTAVNGTGTVTITNLSIVDAATLNLSGNANLTIGAFTGPATDVLATVDASGLTGNLTVTGLGALLQNTASTVTLGSGNDTVNGGTGLGADAITLGGGTDVLFYTAVNQSSGSKVDTIADFVSGTDDIDVTALGINATNTFTGVFNDFGSAQGSLNGVSAQAVFEANFDGNGNGRLWVDQGGGGGFGTLDAADLQIILTGVSTIAATDLNIAGVGNTIDLTAPGANVTTALKNNATNTSTNENDTITASIADLVGSAINAALGTDTMTVSGTAAAGESAGLTVANTTALETVNADSSVEDVAAAIGVLASDGGAVTTLAGVNGTAQSLTVGNTSNLSTTTITDLETLNATGNVTLTSAQHNAFTTINGTGGADTLTVGTAGTMTAADTVETYSITEGSTLTVGNTANGLARVVQETGAVGTVSTIVLGNGTYTGVYTGIDATDVIQVGTTTDVSANTGLNTGAVIDFQNTATAGAGLTLNNTQNGVVTFANTTNAQTVTVNGVADTFTAAAGIETYIVIGGSNVTVNAAQLDVNVTASAAAGSTVLIGGNTVTGTYALGNAADAITATTGANITGVNTGAATTAETLNLTGTITLTGAQYNGFTTVTAAGAADAAAISTSGTYAAQAAVESYTLNGTGADNISFDEVTNAALTDAVRGGQSVSLAGSGADVVTIDNAVNNNGVDSSVNITGFGTDDKLALFANNVANSNGLFVNNYNGAAALGNVATGTVIEIDAASFQLGTLSNTAAVLTALANLPNAVVAAAAASATVVVYDGAGTAGVYEVLENAGGAGTAFDSIELVGMVNATDNALTGVNFQ